LGLQGGLDGLSGQVASGGDGESFDASEDLSVGGGIGGLFQLLGEQQGLLEQQGLQGGLGSKGAWFHGGSLRGIRAASVTPADQNYQKLFMHPNLVSQELETDRKSRLIFLSHFQQVNVSSVKQSAVHMACASVTRWVRV
jgi:hypothetical protein